MANPKSREDRLRTLFKYFVDVVRINIFITTTTGKSIITPELNPYGWKLIVNTSDIRSTFKRSGEFLEYIDPLGLHHFAIPITAGYVVLGPLIINKKLERSQYRDIALQLKRDPDDILDALEDIRVVSQNQLQSILDLISEAKDFFMGDEEPEPATQQGDAAQTLNVALKGLLNTALRLTKAQSGSIMLYKAPKGLSIQVSKGLNPQFVERKPMKLGEGISGYALQEKRTFILTDKADENRIAHLLKRKEIKQSIVMPFESPEGNIRGVLNLNIQDTKSLIKGTDSIIKNLAQMTSSALHAV
jgi:hypothetical protein